MVKTDDENLKSPGEAQPPMKDASTGPQNETNPDRDRQGTEDQAGQNGNWQPVIDLLTQVVERLQSLESSLGLYKAEKKPDEDEEKPGDNPDDGTDDKEQVKKCPQKPAQKAATEDTVAKSQLAKAEQRISDLEKQLNELRKSAKKGPEVIVIDPAAAKDAQKDVQGNPVMKSAGAEQIANFNKIFG